MLEIVVLRLFLCTTFFRKFYLNLKLEATSICQYNWYYDIRCYSIKHGSKNFPIYSLLLALPDLISRLFKVFQVFKRNISNFFKK